MGLLYRLKDQYKILSIVGMAKNAGKTTALNYIIEEAFDEGLMIGLTSSGRDGESLDVVTGTEKPKIYAFSGSIVSIPVRLYELADAGLEILKRTGYGTPLGDILLCRVRESGYIQIAGPLNVRDHRAMCQSMLAMGLDMILVDGAIDRKSIASPDMADGIILATGAVLGRSVQKVVDETDHVAKLYQLNELCDQEARDLILSGQQSGKILLIEQNREHEKECMYRIKELALSTGLGAGRYLDQSIGEDTRYVYLPGALTLHMISDIHPGKYKHTKFIVTNPTKIFIERLAWRQLAKKGFCTEVLQKIDIAAVTVNPYSPLGWILDQTELKEEMEKALDGIAVIDVKREA